MRKATLISLLLVAVLALAACGGGGSSSSGGIDLGREHRGRKHRRGVAGRRLGERSHRSDDRIRKQGHPDGDRTDPHVDGSQSIWNRSTAVYSVDLSVLAKKLEHTKAPAACVASRKKMAAITSQVAALTKSWRATRSSTPKATRRRAYEKGLKIDKLGHNLGTLTAEPTC